MNARLRCTAARPRPPRRRTPRPARRRHRRREHLHHVVEADPARSPATRGRRDRRRSAARRAQREVPLRITVARARQASCRFGLRRAAGRRGPVVQPEGLGARHRQRPRPLRAPPARVSPSTGASERRSILRRCANPARTSVNRPSADGTLTGGSDRRRSRTSAESTLGLGTNTVGGTAHDLRLGEVRHLDRRRAVLGVARVRRPAAPHLALHHHQDALDGIRFLEQPHDHGHGHVVGQVRHDAHGDGPGDERGKVDPASRRRARLGREPPRRRRRRQSAARRRGGRRAPARRRRDRRRAAPGSANRGRVRSRARVPPAGRSARATTRRTVLGSTRKFWPRLRFGWSPSASSGACTRRGGEQSHGSWKPTRSASAIPHESHAPLRPVEHVVHASPRVPAVLLVDPHAHDDLLLGWRGRH